MESTKLPQRIDCHRRRFLGTVATTIAGMRFAIGAPARAQLAGQEENAIAAKDAEMAMLKAQLMAKDTELAALRARIVKLESGEPTPSTGELQGPVGTTQIPGLNWQSSPAIG